MRELLDQERNSRGGENCLGSECVLEVKPTGWADKTDTGVRKGEYQVWLPDPRRMDIPGTGQRRLQEEQVW